MNSENSDLNIIRLANNFITENPYSDGTDFFKILLPKIGEIAFRFVKEMKKLNIHEREWEYCGSKVYPDQDSEDDDWFQEQIRMPDGLDKFTKVIFAEEMEDKIANYVFSEEIMGKIDGFITNNASGITVGGRKYSGKSALIGLVAKKYHFNLVKIDEKYFKNFCLEKLIHEINQFVQKNGQSLLHIDQRRIPHDIFSEIFGATNSDSLIFGSFIIFETNFMKDTNVFIPEFTTLELESHFRNCLQNRLIIQQDQFRKYVSAIPHWAHIHFAKFHRCLQSMSVLTEDVLIKSINATSIPLRSAGKSFTELTK